MGRSAPIETCPALLPGGLDHRPEMRGVLSRSDHARDRADTTGAEAVRGRGRDGHGGGARPARVPTGRGVTGRAARRRRTPEPESPPRRASRPCRPRGHPPRPRAGRRRPLDVSDRRRLRRRPRTGRAPGAATEERGRAVRVLSSVHGRFRGRGAPGRAGPGRVRVRVSGISDGTALGLRFRAACRARPARGCGARSPGVVRASPRCPARPRPTAPSGRRP